MAVGGVDALMRSCARVVVASGRTRGCIRGNAVTLNSRNVHPNAAE